MCCKICFGVTFIECKMLLLRYIQFSKILYLFYIYPFGVLHWKSNSVLHQNVTGPCFIFSIDNLNDNITLAPSCGTVALMVLGHFSDICRPWHRATDFTLSKICEAATLMLSHLSTVIFTTKRFVRVESCG